jgi:hypothetical protein
MRDRLETPRDQSVNQPLKNLAGAKVEDRPINRLLKIHEAAKLELQDLKADFQIRLQESILQTEEKLKLRFADEQEQRVKQTEEEVRKATTQELLARFDIDFQKLRSEFEEREKNAVAAAENAAELRVKEALGEAERAKEGMGADFQSRLQESVLHAEENLKLRFAEEQEQRIKQAQEEVRNATTQELQARFDTDLQKLSSEFEERERNAIAATENAAELRFREALAEAERDKERAKEGVEANFHIRLQESILQTEENLKHRFAEEQEQRTKQTAEEVRNATTQELLERFDIDFQKLSREFEEKERNAIAAAEKAAGLRLKEALAEAERAKESAKEGLEADFQIRLQESIMQTEENLKQRFAEEQEQKIKQTAEDARKSTTHELLERFDLDFQKLSSEFEEREKNSIAAAEKAAELRLKEALVEAERGKERAKEGLEADFQIRLQESILQTEGTLKQRFAEEQEQKIKQTAEEVRNATTHELLERFDLDFQKLSSEFEKREKNSIAAAENAAELRLKEVLGEAQSFKEGLEADFQIRLQESLLQTEQKLKQRFAEEQEQKIKQTEENVREATTRELLARFEVDFKKFESAAEKWDLERQQLHQEITRVVELETELSEVRQEKARLQEELRAVPQVRQKMSPELEAKLEQVMSEKARLEEELGEANARLNAQDQRSETMQAARVDTRDVCDAVKAEIARIESRGREISVKIADPSTDLPTQIRFNRERTELEAYLKGLRYSLGEITFDK